MPVFATEEIRVRSLARSDYDARLPRWRGDKAFYGRAWSNTVPDEVTAATWDRFFTPSEPVWAFIAEYKQCVAGLVHYLFHRSTTRLQDLCYLEGLFTLESPSGRGVGRELIQAVYGAERGAGGSRV
jgi:GNAT superfamily N-acetyltransferase